MLVLPVYTLKPRIAAGQEKNRSPHDPKKKRMPRTLACLERVRRGLSGCSERGGKRISYEGKNARVRATHLQLEGERPYFWREGGGGRMRSKPGNSLYERAKRKGRGGGIRLLAKKSGSSPLRKALNAESVLGLPAKKGGRKRAS